MKMWWMNKSCWLLWMECLWIKSTLSMWDIIDAASMSTFCLVYGKEFIAEWESNMLKLFVISYETCLRRYLDHIKALPKLKIVCLGSNVCYFIPICCNFPIFHACLIVKCNGQNRINWQTIIVSIRMCAKHAYTALHDGWLDRKWEVYEVGGGCEEEKPLICNFKAQWTTLN